MLDTVVLARRVLREDEVPNCKLSTLADFFGARTAPRHRALADALATADVLIALLRRLAAAGVGTLAELTALEVTRPAGARDGGPGPPGRPLAAGPAGGTLPAMARHRRRRRQTWSPRSFWCRADVARIPETAETIAQIPQVSEVYSVTGEFDLVALVRVRAHEELGRRHPRHRSTRSLASRTPRRTSRSAPTHGTTSRPRSPSATPRPPDIRGI